MLINFCSLAFYLQNLVRQEKGYSRVAWNTAWSTGAGGLKTGFVALLLVALTLTGTSAMAEKIGASGNPIPRYIALRTDRANMRTGPSRDYPIKWVYERPGYPLRVMAEDGPWRWVEDPQGVQGWIHLINLVGGSRRTALIKGEPGKKRFKLYAKASATSQIRLTVESGVTGRLMTCKPLWCQLRIEGVRAWIERRHLWGVFPGETY